MVDAHDGETYTAKGSRLIWIDCEMTGLDIFHDELCEISVVPTDFDLNVLDEGIDFVIKPSNAAVANMNDFVRAMHTRSGLINEWENGLSVEEAERKVTEYVARFTPDASSRCSQATPSDQTKNSSTVTCRTSWNTCTTV